MNDLQSDEPNLAKDDLYALPEAAIQNPPTSLWQALCQIGPGIILAASIVGTGELINTTVLGAQAGFVLLWMVLLGCMVKIFVQIELGRHAITRGQTTLAAFNTVPGPRWRASWLCWAWLIMMLLTQTQIAAMESLIGRAANMAFPKISAEFWSILATAAAILLLLSGGYKRLERITTLLVSIVTLLTVAWVVGLGWTDHPIQTSQLASGLTFQLPVEAIFIAFSMFGITGVGASELFAYPYWCIEKGYARQAGAWNKSQDWANRARGWMRVMKLDAWCSLVIYTIATIAFFLLGAAILHPHYGELKEAGKLDDPNLLETLSEMFVGPLRASATFQWLVFPIQVGFFIGASVVLFKTLYVATAGNARLTADLLHIGKFVTIRNQQERDRVVRVFVILYPCLALLICLSVQLPLTLVLIGGAAQSFMLPFIAGATIYLRYRDGDPRVAPSKLSDALLWISSVSMAIIAGFSIYKLVAVLMTK